MSVRAFFQAAKVQGYPSPYDTLHLKIFYPARDTSSDANLGVVPADTDRAPFKIAIFFNGINCGPEVYQWLAVRLAARGSVVVTFSWIAENLPGFVALTPGVDIKMLAPDTYGTGPTASALPAILSVLERLQRDGILAGFLDLNRIILGGHSAGGRVALESADPRFFPQVIGAFAYGAHTAAITQLGYEPGTILPLPEAVPLLLIGGTRDGVIANCSHRYGVTWGSPTTPVQRTFYEGILNPKDNCYLLLLDGANHFSIAHPFDPTTGRSFLDFEATRPEEEVRKLMGDAVIQFVEWCGDREGSAATWEQFLSTSHPAIATVARRSGKES